MTRSIQVNQDKLRERINNKRRERAEPDRDPKVVLPRTSAIAGRGNSSEGTPTSRMTLFFFLLYLFFPSTMALASIDKVFDVPLAEHGASMVGPLKSFASSIFWKPGSTRQPLNDVPPFLPSLSPHGVSST